MGCYRNSKTVVTWRIAILLVTWVFFATVSQSDCSAANIVEMKYEIKIEGTIVNGDYQKFESILLSRKAASNPVRRVLLASNGGDVTTALQIGRLIRLNWIVTSTIGHNYANKRFCDTDDGDFIPMVGGRNCTCDSACFLLWAAGIERFSSGTIVGVHRPYFGSATASALSEPDASAVFQKVTSDVRDYLREMNVPDGYFDIMMSKNSVQIYRLSEEEVDSLKYSPLAEEAIIKTCGIILDKDPAWHDAAIAMVIRQSVHEKSQTPNLDKLLDARVQELMHCEINVVQTAQDRLQSR